MGKRFIARDDLLSYQQAAALSGVSPHTLKHWAKRGQIAYETPSIGRPVKKFRRSVVEALLVKHPPKFLDVVPS